MIHTVHARNEKTVSPEVLGSCKHGSGDDKGREPQGVVIGKARGESHVFVGFGRVAGIMICNISDPNSARCIDYVNNRNLDVAAEASARQYSGIPAAVTRALP